jgi:hypothetical protein
MFSKIIQNHWKKQQLVGINCIAFGDGKIIPLSFHSLISYHKNGSEEDFYVSPICDTTIESIQKYCPDPWVDVTPYGEAIKLANGKTIIGGEGSMGNQGFMVLQDKNEKLLWSLFSTKSNPFFQLELVDNNTIRGYSSSTHDFIYTINISHPEKIEIKAKPV